MQLHPDSKKRAAAKQAYRRYKRGMEEGQRRYEAMSPQERARFDEAAERFGRKMAAGLAEKEQPAEPID
jgi:hypothetical protein